MIGAGSGIDVFLRSGEWYFGGRDVRLRTTLGSCVAVTLWHSKRSLGGMCHYMLPSRGSADTGEALSGRYGVEAIRLLEEEVVRSRTMLKDYEVKLFGGATLLHDATHSSSIAARNIVTARAWVARNKLKVVAESLGEACYRQLIFDINSGYVWMRRGPQAKPAVVVAV